jgi:hypothetical protein
MSCLTYLAIRYVKYPNAKGQLRHFNLEVMVLILTRVMVNQLIHTPVILEQGNAKSVEVRMWVPRINSIFYMTDFS